MTRQERALSVSLHSAQYPSFPPRFRARTDATLLRQAPIEGGRSAERRSGAAAPVGHAMTRRVRRLRGALRPMMQQDASRNNVTISMSDSRSVPIVSKTEIDPMKTAISRMLALVTTTALTELLAEKQKPGSEAR